MQYANRGCPTHTQLCVCVGKKEQDFWGENKKIFLELLLAGWFTYSDDYFSGMEKNGKVEVYVVELYGHVVVTCRTDAH